jgi:Nif-specific regulatory protein
VKERPCGWCGRKTPAAFPKKWCKGLGFRCESIAGAVFKSRKTEVISDVRKDPRHFRGVDRAAGFESRSILAIPLVSGDRTVGVLECINKRRGRFLPEDVELGEALAGILCLAIEKAELIDRLERANAELRALVDLRSQQLEKIEREKQRLLREVEGRYHFEQIVGSSDAMLQVFQHARHAVDSDITVLIQGETGTGKELIARCLHFGGSRKAGPFVAENCATIAPGLFASELFGHVKGAFSGADRDRKGLIERADGGTLFLDEIGDLPMEIQKGLLRALEDGCFRPVGSNEIRRSDFRLITATHKDLEREVETGRFREDLYYRIGVFRIHLPPLRERHGDIPLLASFFLNKFDEKYQKNSPAIDPAALQCLESWPFPGNVRELRNEIERAVAVAEDGRPIGLEHLSPRLLGNVSSSCRSHPGNLKDRVEALERTLIVDALKACGGNQTKAADLLGLSRYGLAKKIKRYGLSEAVLACQPN